VSRTVLYLTWNSIGDPLVYSQVLGYLHGLVEKGWRFVLVTMEAGRSPEWLSTQQERLRWILDQNFGLPRVDWRPVVISGLGVRLGVPLKLWLIRRHVSAILAAGPVSLIHARSYLPAWVASKAAGCAGIPWLFDTRGFWVDEKVYKGGLPAAGLRFKVLKEQERRLYAAADGVVMLAEAGKNFLQRKKWLTDNVPVAVIPTCVDTARFHPGVPTADRRLLCVGSVGPGYLGQAVLRLFATAQRVLPDYRCELYTCSDSRLVDRLARQEGVDLGRVRVRALPPERMPEVLSGGGVGVSFIRPHVSKLASCPTKVGEYLACGMPVLYNPGIGDMDQVLGDGSVAVRCDDFSPATLENALRRAAALVDAPHTGRRCRALARSYFSLEKGVAAYDALYRRLLGRGGMVCPDSGVSLTGSRTEVVS